MLMLKVLAAEGCFQWIQSLWLSPGFALATPLSLLGRHLGCTSRTPNK